MSDKAPTFVKDGKAYLRDADGHVFKTDPSAAAAKIAEGDRFAITAEEYAQHERDKKAQTTGAQIKTGLESAAAGAIDAAQAPIALPLRANAALWGDADPLKDISGRKTVENIAALWGGATSDRNAEAYGREYGENARARAELNPATAFAGNVAGSLAGGGALAGGAKALGAGAAKALGEGLAARASGALATGALEGAAYGQAQAGEEAYLHNIPLTGEKLIAAMGWGALLGGGVSLAAHGGGALLRRGSRGATPLDSPRLPAQAEAPLDVASGLGEPPAQAVPIDVNVGAFDRSSMRDESFKYLRSDAAKGPHGADRLGKPRIEIYPEFDGSPETATVADGRHRMTLAAERGDKTIAADVVRYDEEGNVISKTTQDVSLSNAPAKSWRDAVSIGEAAAPEAGALVTDAAAEGAGAAPSRFSNGLRDFADERTAKALGARGSTLKKLGRNAQQAEQTMHDMARTVRGVTLDDGTPVFRALDSQEELSARVLKAKEEAGAKLGAFREKTDKVFEAHPEIAPQADAIADRIEQEVVAPLESHPLSSVAAQAAPVRQLVNDIREMAAQRFEAVPQGNGRKLVQPKTGKTPVSVADLTRLRQGLDDQIYQAKRGVNLTQQGAPPNLKDLERARGILEESIEAASDKAATFFDQKAAQAYKQIKTQFRHLLLASDIAGAAELQNLGNRVVSPSDYGVGAAAGVLGGGPIGAVASAFAHKTIREHSSAVLAVLADKLANNLDGKIESGLGAFFRESTARASAAAAGLDRTASAVPLKRLVTPAAVEAFQGKSKDLRAAYEKRIAELADANRDMGAGVRASMQSAMGGGAETMPRLTQAATITATRGAQYLESQLPAGTAAPTMFQPSRKFSPSDLQIREFAQKWSAVANPLSVIDDLRRGTVTHAQVDALKAVYPELYAEVQLKALEKIRELDQSGKRMPFNDRLQLDLFLDLHGAGEPTLVGAFIDRVGAMQAAKAKVDTQPKAGRTTASLNKIGVSRQSGAQETLGG
ncbi:MAG TPA: hypothetical protein VER96_33855 [Polyangiaceae bacterium]|nr:hypothetical protein [Polyangiaceae bacterium]